MRIGSPVGGGCGLPGSPSNDLIGKATGMPNDVEAAIAMVGLSGCFGNNGISPAIVQKSPTSIKAIAFDTVKVESSDLDDVSKNCDSLLRSVHIKCPVMPERHSFVQKALKRKIENRMEPTMVMSRERVDDRMTMTANSAERRTTPDDRDEIVMAKRFRYEHEVEQQRQQQQHVGRFVRTCQPCHLDDLKHQQRQLEGRQQPLGRIVDTRKLSRIDSPRESFHRAEMEQNVGRFVRTGQPCQTGDMWKGAHHALVHEGGSPVSIPVSKATGLERATILQSADSKYIVSQRYPTNAEELPKPSFAVGSPAGQVNGWLSQMPKTYQGTKIQPFIKRPDFSRIPSGSPSGGTMSSSTVGRQHIPFNHSIVRDDNAQLNQAERVYCPPGMKVVNFNQQGRKSDNLNALYSLGRYAASVCMPTIRRQQLARSSDATSAPVESQLLYSPTKQRFNSASLKDVHFPRGRSNENSAAVRIARVRNLDTRTERKVSNGEFGSLHSLQMFYNTLSKKPTSLESSQPRQPLSSITNQFAVKHEDDEERDDSWGQYSDGVEETALDLSMHTNRAEVDFSNDPMPRPAVPSQIMRRKSRSCCSSPVSGVTMLRRGTRETSTEYIDRLLFLESRSDLFHPDQTTKSADNATSLPSSPFASQKADDEETAKSSPSKPNKMLPLKKRRLVEVDDSDKETSSNSRSPASLEYSSMDLKEEMVYNQQLGDIGSKSRGIASAVTQPDEDGDLPLHKAVAQRKIGIVSEVIKMMSRIGASLDDYNNLKQTAMHIAVLTDQPDVLRLLLMAGASPNVVDQNGLTSIHHASKLRSSSCLQCIVEYSSDPLDVNAVTYHGLAPLHLAVKCRNASAVVTLIEAGACVDVRDRANGRTPLFYAVEQNDGRISALLLKCGADPTMFAYSGCSPAVAAANARCSTEVARLLNAYTSADDRCLGSVLPTACLG